MNDKKAWFFESDLLIRLITDTSIIDNNGMTGVEFDSSLIESGYEMIAMINLEYTVIEDTVKKESDILKRNIDREMLKMDYGKQILAYIGVKLNTYSVEQYQQLLIDDNIKMIQTLLTQGALESSYSLLSDYQVNELITQNLKDDILAKILFFINLLGE
jgi:hypothetical protein